MTVPVGAIIEALDGEWRTALEVFNRVGAWSPITIRHKLNLIAEAGTIERRKVPIKNNSFRYEYRREPATR